MSHDAEHGGASRREFLAAATGTGLAALAGCTSNTGGTPTDAGGENLSGSINISGSSTVFPLAVEMKEQFQEEHPDVSISVSPTGTGGGFNNEFCPGNTDFNNASRPITDSEEQLCSDNDIDPIELRVATDAVTVIVNNDAGWFDDGCITVDQLGQIWRPDSPAERWSDVDSNWPDEPIKLFGPTDASGTFDYFTEEIVGEEGASRSDYQATEQDNTIIQGVSQNEYAMGYMGFAYYTNNADRVTALGVDDGDGCVEPSLETAKSGEYAPLSRPLFTYVAESSLAEEHVAEFATFFVESSTSQEIVADEVGYVPNTDDTEEEMMTRLQDAIDSAQG